MGNKIFKKCLGMWARGPEDEIPEGHLSAAYNVDFRDAPIQLRNGLYVKDTYASTILRARLYKPQPPYSVTNFPRLLLLFNVGGSGHLFDAANTASPILIIAAMRDFALLNMFGRAYIAPIGADNKYGIDDLYVYENNTGAAGLTAATKAGGARPTVAAVASLSGSSGVMTTPGTYYFSYAWETRSGFITKPAPFDGIDNLGGLGSFDLAITGGPTGSATWIIGTKATQLRANLGDPIDSSDESVQRYPIYFIKRIPNNISATHNVSYYDENLRDSADYLWNRMETIPAGVFLTEYNGRLITGGNVNDPSLLYASEPGEPESVSATGGFQTVDPNESEGLSNAVAFRGSLIVFKYSSTSLTQDTETDIASWQIDTTDSIGTVSNGIGTNIDLKRPSHDGFIVGDKTGILFFNGIFNKTPLTWKIDTQWKTITASYYYELNIVVDSIKKFIYAVFPSYGVVVGDYLDGLSAETIKWSIYQFHSLPITSAVIYDDTVLAKTLTVFTIGSDVLVLDKDTLNDKTTPIVPIVTIPNIRFGSGISVVHGVKIKIQGSGTVNMNLVGNSTDRSSEVTNAYAPESISLVPTGSITPLWEYDKLANIVSEEIRLSITMSSALANKLKIYRVEIMGQELWLERPR